MRKGKLRIDWYKLLYSTKDEVLIGMFWKFYNSHRLSKNRAARSVLVHYYSTTPAPDFVKKHLTLKHDIELVRFNFYEV